MRLPAYSPDFNADEHVWGWVRQEVTANTRFGTAAKVREHVDALLAGLSARAEEVTRRCRTVRQARADALEAVGATTASCTTRDALLIPMPTYADPNLALL